MKRLINASTTAKNVERITIDFYGGVDVEEEITAVANPKKVFKNTQVVIRDVKAYLKSKGLKILFVKKSDNEDSDSTYYDVDVKVANPKGKTKYIYLRVSDHTEDPNNEEARQNFHDRKTRDYENLPEDADVSELYKYKSIDVTGKRYDNYDRAMNRVKEIINEILSAEGII